MIKERALAVWMEQEDVIGFLQESIRLNTVNPPGNELRLAKRIKAVLEQYGIESQLFPYGEGRANLVARLRGQRPGRRLIFNGHLDTVPVGEMAWDVPPFSGEIREGRLYGRGSTDMKSGLLALLYAFIYTKVSGTRFDGELLFTATFGEENGSEGAKVMVEEKQIPPFDAMVIAEPTHNRIFVVHKGVLWVEVVSTGKTAHGSMPDQGINAILPINQFINRLKQVKLAYEPHPLLSKPTISITTIHGGMKTNVIPDRCKLTLDIRTLPGQKHEEILGELQKIADEVMAQDPSASLEIKAEISMPGIATDPSSALVQAACQVMQVGPEAVAGVNYFTDGSIFSTYSQGEIILLGPGIPELAHQPDEYVEVDRYTEAIQIYYQLAKTYLGGLAR